MPSALFEIVPNVSEGRDATVVDACAAAMERAGARVIDRTSDHVHHRSVLTAVGSASEVVAAAVALAGAARDRIDLRAHRGRTRASGRSTCSRSCRCAARRSPTPPRWHARRPSAFGKCGASRACSTVRPRPPRTANRSRRCAPENSRGSRERWRDPRWRPDFGDEAHPSAGAIAVGAREVLIAFNVELRTGELAVARRIARALRERDGGLRTLRALGIALGPGRVQVSFNITDYRATPVYRIVELVRILAAREGVAVAGCELIGLAPQAAIDESARFYLETLG